MGANQPLYASWKNDPARGSVPVATALSPVLQEINSPLLDWYYANQSTDDELIAGRKRPTHALISPRLTMGYFGAQK